MKKSTLAFGTKINRTFAALAVVLALTVGFGFYTAVSLSALLENATGKTLRKIQLAGALNTAKSNLAVGTRSIVLFTYAKDPSQVSAAKQLFTENSELFRQALVDIGPLLVTDEGKQAVSTIESRFGQFVQGYREVEH